MLRHGMCQSMMQQTGLAVVGETSSAAQALKLAADLRPDLIVMDYHLPDMNGIEATRQILTIQPAVKVVIFTSNASRPVVDEALHAGVCGYVLKSGDVSELAHAIDVVMTGKLYLSPEVSAGILEGYRKGLGEEASPAKPVLSDREKLLLRLVTEGRRNKEMAVELLISIKTVEANRARLMKKLNCSSSAELVRYAIREGISVP